METQQNRHTCVPFPTSAVCRNKGFFVSQANEIEKWIIVSSFLTNLNGLKSHRLLQGSNKNNQRTWKWNALKKTHYVRKDFADLAFFPLHPRLPSQPPRSPSPALHVKKNCAGRKILCKVSVSPAIWGRRGALHKFNMFVTQRGGGPEQNGN